MPDKKKKVSQYPKDDTIQETREVKLLAAPKGLVHVPRLERKQKRPSRINTPMETQHFVFSQLAILISALLFLGGMYWVLNNPTLQARIAEGDYLPVTLKQASFGLEINNPEDELLTFSNSIIVSGSTSPKSSVIITVAGNTNHFDAMEADNDGKFQRTVSLSPGLNRLEISSFDADQQNTKTIARTIYYSEEKLP